MELTESASLPEPMGEQESEFEASQPAKGLWRETFENLIHTPSAIIGMIILFKVLPNYDWR